MAAPLDLDPARLARDNIEQCHEALKRLQDPGTVARALHRIISNSQRVIDAAATAAPPTGATVTRLSVVPRVPPTPGRPA